MSRLSESTTAEPSANGHQENLSRRERAVRQGVQPDLAALAAIGIGELVFTPATDIKEQAPRWVWKDRVPRGTLTLAAGKGGSCKSLFCAWFAAELTRGELEGCWLGQPKRVLWLTLEASWEIEIKPRLMAAGADLALVEFAKVRVGENDHIRVFDPQYVAQLRAKVEQDDVGLIVLDPALDVLGRVNTRDQQEVRDAIGGIAAFADEMAILVLGIAHFNKMSTVDDALDRITGSAAFSQRVRAALVFAYNDEDDRYVLSEPKNNWGTTTLNGALPNLSFSVEPVEVKRGLTSIRLRWEDDSEYSVDDVLGKKHKQGGETKLEQAMQAIRYELRNQTKRCRSEVIAACLDKGSKMNAIKDAAKAIGVISTKCLHNEGARSRADSAAKDWELPPAGSY